MRKLTSLVQSSSTLIVSTICSALIIFLATPAIADDCPPSGCYTGQAKGHIENGVMVIGKDVKSRLKSKQSSIESKKSEIYTGSTN